MDCLGIAGHSPLREWNAASGFFDIASVCVFNVTGAFGALCIAHAFRDVASVRVRAGDRVARATPSPERELVCENADAPRGDRGEHKPD